MRNPLLRFLVAAVIAAPLCVAPTRALAFDGTVTVDGTKSPRPKADPVHPIRVLALHFDVAAPHDPVTGQATGKRTHTPFCFTTPAGPTSLPFLQSLLSQELIGSLSFELSSGYKIKLSNAVVSSFQMASGDAKDQEEVCVVFQKLEIAHAQGAAPVVLDNAHP